MQRVQLRFDITSYWHIGSGTGQGAYLDAVVLKTKDGLPYIPGKTIKGLLREAALLAEECGKTAKGSTEKLFGTSNNDTKVSRFDTTSGQLFFSSATLGRNVELWAKANKADTDLLYRQIASTKINDKGLAESKTLRRIEVAAPLTLMAVVDSGSNEKLWIETLKIAACLVRHLGSHRHRGLGRTIVTLEEAH